MTDALAALNTSRLRVLAAVGAGVVFALGQPPFDLWYLAIAALVAVFFLLRLTATAIQAAATGWAFGVGYFALSLSWITEPFFVDAATTGWMAPFALIGMAGGLSLFWGAACWLGKRLGGGVWMALLWAVAELARAYVLTGFPWGLVGYVWAPSWGIQWVSVIGPHGLTLVTLLAAYGAAQNRWRLRGLALGTVVVILLGGFALQPALQDLTGRPVVRLIQPNAAQHQKWDPAYIPIFFERQIDLTSQAPKVDLIVWPETAIPSLLNNADAAFEVIADAAQGTSVALGLQRYDDQGYFNSMVVLDSSAKLSALYDKHHLVPFGEYMPLAEFFARFNILGLAARAQGGYASGQGAQLIDLGALGKGLPLICYEAVFPQDVLAAPERPAVLLHLTNDAWFGSRSGPYQHLQQARIRAIETGLPLLRAANTGVSAVIDPAGRVLASLPLGQSGALDHPVPVGRAATVYWRTGDLGAIFLILVFSLASIALRHRNPH